MRDDEYIMGAADHPPRCAPQASPPQNLLLGHRPVALRYQARPALRKISIFLLDNSLHGVDAGPKHLTRVDLIWILLSVILHRPDEGVVISVSMLILQMPLDSTGDLGVGDAEARAAPAVSRPALANSS